jgi:hypothetical protein
MLRLGELAALSALQTKKVLQLGLLWSLVLHLETATASGTVLCQRTQKVGMLGILSVLDLKVTERKRGRKKTESERGRMKEALSKKVGQFLVFRRAIHSQKATERGQGNESTGPSALPLTKSAV